MMKIRLAFCALLIVLVTSVTVALFTTELAEPTAGATPTTSQTAPVSTTEAPTTTTTESPTTTVTEAPAVTQAPTTVRPRVAATTVKPRPVAEQGTGRCGGDLPPCYVMMRESGGNVTAKNPHSTASGKWQVLNSTWQGYSGYARAMDAPESVQDAFARGLWAGGAGCAHWRAC